MLNVDYKILGLSWHVRLTTGTAYQGCMKQVRYKGPTNIRRDSTKLSRHGDQVPWSYAGLL